MKKNSVFEGISCAIVTPFDRDGRIDYEAYSVILERVLDGGCSSVTVCRTTGEAATLSDNEHFELVRYTVEQVRGRVPVIAGNGSNCTSHAKELTDACCEAGCDALLTVTPYYNRATAEGLMRSFCEIADVATRPMILYNVPPRTSVSIPFEVYRELSYHKRIVGVKDASGDVSSTLRLISELGSRLDVYCGNDDILFPMLACGCKGGISVAANIVPRDLSDMYGAARDGRYTDALDIQLRLSSLISTLFCRVNPIPIKHALYRMGLCSDRMRLPLCPPDEEAKRLIVDTLRKYSLI